MYILNTEGSDRILRYPFESLLLNLIEHVELTSRCHFRIPRCGEGKEFSLHYYTAHDHLNALRLWWHIDPRDPPAPQSLPHNHDLHVGHPRASPAPSLSSPRSVHGVTRVVPAPKRNKTKDKVCIRRIFKERRGSSRKCRPDLFPSVLRFFASFLTFPD